MVIPIENTSREVDHPQPSTPTPTPASAPAPVLTTQRTIPPFLAPVQPSTPGYGQLLLDPLNDPRAATGLPQLGPRDIFSWRDYQQGNTSLPQGRAQQIPRSHSAHLQAQPRPHMHTPVAREADEVLHIDPWPNAASAAHREPQPRAHGWDAVAAREPSLSPVAATERYGGILAPPPDVHIENNSIRPINPASVLRHPTTNLPPTLAE